MIYTDKMIKRKKSERKKINIFLKILIYPFVILLILMVFYSGYIKYVKHENDINIFGFRQYVVATGSMEPEYKVGDLIIIKETPKEKIKVGDIINYISENEKETITHRVKEIIEKDGQTFYKTKGDNNNSDDQELINYNNVQGILVFKISKLGTIITKLLTGSGVSILIVLIILSYLKDKNKEDKKTARENARKIFNVPKYEENDT